MATAFDALRYAFDLRERHPYAESAEVLVLCVMARYADGRTGKNIRPGLDAICAHTGYSRRTVQRAIKLLESMGEITRTRQGRRHTGAACWTMNLQGDTGDTLMNLRVTPAASQGDTGVSPSLRPTITRPSGSSGPCRFCGDGEIRCTTYTSSRECAMITNKKEIHA